MHSRVYSENIPRHWSNFDAACWSNFDAACCLYVAMVWTTKCSISIAVCLTCASGMLNSWDEGTWLKRTRRLVPVGFDQMGGTQYTADSSVAANLKSIST